jgi:uncharacterized repeat protein (TIGR04076 family)
MKDYELEAEVVEIRGIGRCPLGIKVGDKFEIDDEGSDLCGWAYHTMFPFLTVLQYGGSFPWEPYSDQSLICCPDPHNTVVFKITRKELK